MTPSSPTVERSRSARAETGHDTGPSTVGSFRPRPASSSVTDGQGTAVTGASPHKTNAAGSGQPAALSNP